MLVISKAIFCVLVGLVPIFSYFAHDYGIMTSCLHTGSFTLSVIKVIPTLHRTYSADSGLMANANTTFPSFLIRQELDLLDWLV
jgi:hypothetical protein